MSVGGGGERASSVALYAGAIVVPLVVGVVAYLGLIVREKVQAKTWSDRSTHLEQEIIRAKDFLRRHQNDRLTEQQINEVAAELKGRIMEGPTDLEIIEYLQTEAQKAGVVDLKAEVEGGIKVPRVPSDRTGLDRLSVDPAKLQGTVVDISFSSRYRDCLVFLKSIYEAKWPMEVLRLDLQRLLHTPKIAVRIQVRYLYE